MMLSEMLSARRVLFTFLTHIYMYDKHVSSSSYATHVIHIIANRSNVLGLEKQLIVRYCLSTLSCIAPQTHMIADSHDFGQTLLSSGPSVRHGSSAHGLARRCGDLAGADVEGESQDHRTQPALGEAVCMRCNHGAEHASYDTLVSSSSYDTHVSSTI